MPDSWPAGNGNLNSHTFPLFSIYTDTEEYEPLPIISLYSMRDKRIVIYFITGLTAGFLLLVVYVHFLPTSWIDIEFSEEMQEHRNPLLDTAMKVVSWFGVRSVAISMVGLTGLVFWFLHYRRETYFILLTLTSSLLVYGIKVAVGRPRPTEDLVQIIQQAQHQSFPSGHTVFYLVFFGFITFLMYRLQRFPKPIRVIIGVVSLSLIFSIPFSRVYLGDHWLTDVLGGIFLGLLLLSGIIYGYLGKRIR